MKIKLTQSDYIKRNKVFLISIMIVVIDQFTKIWVTTVLNEGSSVKAIPHILNIQLVYNTGAAFSSFKDSTLSLSIISLVVGLGLIYFIIRIKNLPFNEGISTAFLLGGTIGNGIDRWRLGKVVDFLVLVPVNFPVFNIADISINLAILFFGINLFSGDKIKGRE